MEFIANALNNNILRNILPTKDDEVDGVLAAIAYGSNFGDADLDLIGHSTRHRYRLDIWMRYDHTVPVSPVLLRRILKHHKDNIFCKLVPDCLHSKVIWWKGYGAYIGSANHTDRAWVNNIEAGIFLTESDLQMDGMRDQLENFFEKLRNTKECIPLSIEIIEELEAMEVDRRGVYEKGKTSRKVPVWGGPTQTYSTDTNAAEKQKNDFKREWQETLSHLRSIGELLKEHRPSWVKPDTPIEWQIDQFLHAYYYNKVGEVNHKPYEDYFIKNHDNPNQAVNNAIEWWGKTSAAPSHEDVTLYQNAPLIRNYLSKSNILNLSELNFGEVCSATHATKDHINKMKLSLLGRPDLTSLSLNERIPLYASWLLKQRNKKGWNVLQLLNYVLYEGATKDFLDRLYTASTDPNYHLPHYGLNSIAEVSGWAHPKISPPRNGRTSKALKALGFDVRIY